MRLENKICVVTGGARGIGAEICREFHRRGARVAVVDNDPSGAQTLADELGPDRAGAWECNVTEAAQVEKTVADIVDLWGPIDVWVNNAGVSYILPTLECSEEIWDRTLDVNLKGTFLCCQAVLRRMVDQNTGVILNMSSQSGKAGNSHYAAYCASKFGIIGLTQSLAMEFASSGVRVNALCPGVVLTPMWDEMIGDYARKRDMSIEEVRPYLESKVPLGRLATPQDVAHAAAFLASDEASYITGQSLNVSGGAVMH